MIPDATQKRYAALMLAYTVSQLELYVLGGAFLLALVALVTLLAYRLSRLSVKQPITSRQIFAALLAVLVATPTGIVLGAMSAGFFTAPPVTRVELYVQCVVALVPGIFWLVCFFDEFYRSWSGDTPPESL